MNPAFVTVALIALMLPVAGLASPREELLSQYAAAAKAASPGFSGFSASRGEKLHFATFHSGKPDTPSDAVAISVTPTRYSDPAKVEKWFKRNCNDVLGRECTALEKGDWLSYMISQ